MSAQIARAVSASKVFSLDYTDLEAVKRLADSFGRGMTVFKHPARENYNVIHTSRKDLYKPEWVKYQT